MKMIKPKAKNKKEYYIGIDIGGTNIKYLVRTRKKVLEEGLYETKKIKSKKDFLRVTHNLIDNAIEKYGNIKGIGIGSRGRIHKGKINDKYVYSFLKDFNEIKDIKGKYNIEAKLVNDALPPYYIIKNKVKNKNILLVSLGTGLGTEINMKGRFLDKEDFSSNFAHKKFRDSTREDYVSSEFLVKRTKEEKLNVNSAKELFILAKKDKTAKKIFKELGENLGEIISIITNKYSIDEVYITGGISNASKLFLPSTKKSLKKHSTKKTVPKIKIIKSKHEVGALGASMMFE